jgi:hypothetical protein
MKTIANLFKPILKDRKMLILMASVFISGIIFFIFMILNTKSYDYLLNVRYTVFGTSEFYKDSWTYRVVLAIFGLIISFIHNIIIAKIYSISGRRAAAVFAIFSIILVLIGMIIIGASIREIPN